MKPDQTDAPVERKAGNGSEQAEVSTPPPVSLEAVSQLSRPSTLRYRKLIEEIIRANQAVEAGVDELSVILKYIVSLRHFLDADRTVRDHFLTRPLGTLAKSLRDLGQGARPALFFDRPKKGPGRPKDVSFEAARGAIAAAVATLIEWGEGRNAAGKFVAEQLQEIGLKLPTGGTVQTKHVLRWRDDIGATASTLAENTYRDAKAKYARVPPEIAADPKKRRVFVLGALAAIWSMGF
jgi:hypothetical protein